MDNATKALLIAAAVLIAIIIIALSVRLLNVNDDSGQIAGELVQGKTGDASIRAVDEIGKIGINNTQSKTRWTLINDANDNGNPDVGDKCKIDGTNEEFYVIKTNSTTVTLLAAKCVNTSTWKQDDNYNKVAFDTKDENDNYTNVYNNASIKVLVNNYFSAWDIENTGRLLLKGELEDLLRNLTSENKAKILLNWKFWVGDGGTTIGDNKYAYAMDSRIQTW